MSNTNEHPVTPPCFGTGYRKAFRKNHLTLGVGFPIEAYDGPIATLEHQLARAQAAEKGGFAVVWCRDIPVIGAIKTRQSQAQLDVLPKCHAGDLPLLVSGNSPSKR